jgi:predicted PurR-regulated permease PerM
MADNNKTQEVIDIIIRVSLLGLLLFLCFKIMSPFLGLLVWGMILATAVSPIYKRLVPRLGNKEGLTASLLVIVVITLLIVPVFEMTTSFINSIQAVVAKFEAGTLKIPPPGDSVLGWPIVGERIHAFWSLASSNLESLIAEYRDQLASLTQPLLGIAASLGGGVASFIVSTIIAGAFLAYEKESQSFFVKLLDRLIDDKGHYFADLSTQTVRSVAQGVIGVALIQAILSAFGLILMDVPAWGVWVVLVLVFAVVQLPPLIVLGPIMIYVFSANDTLPAIIFMIYAIFVSISDTFLKPLFLGRGMDIPMPVILFGAIGGVVLLGILGLFIGAVVLAVSYTLFLDWLNGPVENGPVEEVSDSSEE